MLHFLVLVTLGTYIYNSNKLLSVFPYIFTCKKWCIYVSIYSIRIYNLNT